jgi:predicted outer membrane repeat protein
MNHSSVCPSKIIAFVMAMVIIATASLHPNVARAEGEIVDAGVVGNGTPASCTEAALTTALAGGGTITFNCGGPKTILVITEKSITQNTTIDGGDVITITGGLATRLFSTVPGAGTSLEMRNIILDGAFSNNASGAAVRAFGPLTLTHITVQNSVAAPGYCGGAVLIGGDAFIADSTFSSNTAALGGGAICTRSLPTQTVQISNSFFSNNKATDTMLGLGGAVYADIASRPRIVDSVFLGNSAHFGGAAYVGPTARLDMQGTTANPIFSSKLQINGNSATEDGGALYNKGGTLVLTNAIITVNRTPTQTVLAGYGGAIYNEGVLTLTNAIVSKNEGRFGGGIFVGNSVTAQAVLDRVFVTRNVSGNLGGGMYMNTLTTTVTISNSGFHRNSAVGSGGGLARTNSQLKIYNSSFTFNAVSDANAVGGGLMLQTLPTGAFAGYVQMRNVTISSNSTNQSSGKGGGLYNFNSGVEMYFSTIVSNTNGVYSTGNGNSRFRSTVLQNPGFLNCDGDGTGSVSDDSHNYSTDSSCPLPTSQPGGARPDPLLGPFTFEFNGFITYHAPLPGSPLINAGASNCPTKDQIGATRLDDCDIGAIEFGGVLPRAYVPFVAKS